MLELLAAERQVEMLGYTVFLSVARITPFVLVNPIFSRNQFQTGILQMAIIIALSFPVFPSVFFQLNAYGVPTVAMVTALVAKELIIGLVLTLLLSVPLWAVDEAGKFVEAMVGFNAASEGEISGAVGTLFLMLTFLFLFSADWFYFLFLNPFYQSYEIWPPLASLPVPVETVLFDIVHVLDKVSLTGFLIALPLVALFLLGDMVAGFLLKFTQAINPGFMMSSVKPLLFVLLLVPFISTFMIVVENGLAELVTAIPTMEGLLPPQTTGGDLGRQQ